MFILTDGIDAIGPFDTFQDALNYQVNWGNLGRYKIIGLFRP